MDRIFFNKKSIYLIIILSFFISLTLSKYYLTTYDLSINKDFNQKIEHPMIKASINNHWYEANEIINDINKGKNFFISGAEYDEFLPQRLLALYYLIINENILDQNNKLEIKNKKLGFLVIHTIFFYLSLFYLTKVLIKKFPLKNVFLTIAFISLEPTIFQYHSSFYNESYVFPLQIFLFGLLIQNKRGLVPNFTIGILLGLMYCFGTEFLLYFIPVSIYITLVLKKKSLIPIVSLLIGLGFIFSLISLHNFLRVNNSYFATEGSKTAFYVYIAPSVYADKKKISLLEAKELMLQDMKNWAIRNNIILNNPNTYSVMNIVTNKEDEIKFLNYLQRTSLEIMINSPYYLAKYVFKKTVHALTLDPFYIKNFYKYDSGGKNKYYGSKDQRENIPYRIFYSFVLYLIILRGAYNLIKSKEINIINLVLLLFLYQVIVLGWMGTNRYLMPILIYSSIFFSFGIFPKKNY